MAMKHVSEDLPESTSGILGRLGALLGFDLRKVVLDFDRKTLELWWNAGEGEELAAPPDEVDSLSVLYHKIAFKTTGRVMELPAGPSTALVGALMALSASRRYARAWCCQNLDNLRDWLKLPEIVPIGETFLGLPLYVDPSWNDDRNLVLFGSKTMGSPLESVSEGRLVLMVEDEARAAAEEGLTTGD